MMVCRLSYEHISRSDLWDRYQRVNRYITLLKEIQTVTGIIYSCWTSQNRREIQLKATSLIGQKKTPNFKRKCENQPETFFCSYISRICTSNPQSLHSVNCQAGCQSSNVNCTMSARIAIASTEVGYGNMSRPLESGVCAMDYAIQPMQTSARFMVLSPTNLEYLIPTSSRCCIPATPVGSQALTLQE